MKNNDFGKICTTVSGLNSPTAIITYMLVVTHDNAHALAYTT